MQLYVYLNGERRGPFPEHRVRSYLADGFLRSNDLVGERLDGDWKPLDSFLAPETTDTPPVAPVVANPPTAAAPPPSAITHDSLGSYARATIAPDETVLYKTRIHWIAFARSAGLALLAFFFLAIPFGIAVQAFTGSELGWIALVFPLLLFISPAVAYMSSELVITSRRVLIKTGYLHRETREMFVSKIESVSVNQSVAGRMLDYGTVVIRGTGGSEELFGTIAHPLVFRNRVQQLQTAGASS